MRLWIRVASAGGALYAPVAALVPHPPAEGDRPRTPFRHPLLALSARLYPARHLYPLSTAIPFPLFPRRHVRFVVLPALLAVSRLPALLALTCEA